MTIIIDLLFLVAGVLGVIGVTAIGVFMLATTGADLHDHRHDAD